MIVLTIDVEQANLTSIFGIVTLKGEVKVVLFPAFAEEFDLDTHCPKTEACYTEIVRLIKTNLPSTTKNFIPTEWDLHLIEWNVKAVETYNSEKK